MQFSKSITQIRQSLYKTSLTNELNHLNPNSSKAKELTNIITTLTETTANPGTNDVDQYIYKRIWRLLHPIHRLVKITEYVKDNIDEQYQTNILTQLTDLINNKKLTSKKHITYDPLQEKIIAIHALKFKKGKYTIKL